MLEGDSGHLERTVEQPGPLDCFAGDGSALATIREAATLLKVSQSWMRRHIHELPHVRTGRLLRFNLPLLRRQFECKTSPGNRLESERIFPMFRRYQKGSVIQRGRKGRRMWYGIFRQDVPLTNGKAKRKQVFAWLGPVSEYPNRSMAVELLRQKMNAKPCPQTTFGELVLGWRENIVPTIKESTANYYNKMLDSHVVPHFGNTEISRIKSYDVEQFLAQKARQGFCRNTIRGMRVSLGRVLKWAVHSEWLPKNPCDGVALPQAGEKVKRTILRPEQVLSIVAQLQEPYGTFVLFLAITGLRAGEASAVKWSDIEGTELHVCRRVYEGKVGEVKTKSSLRILPLPQELINKMRTLEPGEYIFQTRSGTPLNPGNAAHRHLRPVLRKLGIHLGGWHDFRHTFTTLSLKEYPLKAVSKALGHANTKVTTEVYQHIDTEGVGAPLAGMSSKLLASVGKSDDSAGREKGKFLN
jgi:excisionase family DNA binding protein